MTQHQDNKPQPAQEGTESAAPERKERVIHTRVPALLEQELKRMAQSLRVPVSNVVRAILEDAVDAVDRVGRKAEGEVRGLAERLAHNRDRFRGMALGHTADLGRGSVDEQGREPGEEGPMGGVPSEGAERGSDAEGEPALGDPARSTATIPQALQGVLGFQPLVLALEACCAVCGRGLEIGEQVFLGVRATDGPRVLIGHECLPAPRRQAVDKEKTP